MTAAALAPAIEYLGNGVTTEFAAPFRFLSGTLAVALIDADGDVTELAEGVNYSVLGGSTDDGGTVTCALAPAVGVRVRIRRVTPRAQQTHYETNDDFPAETHEAALDRAMLIDQEQDVQIQDTAARAILVPDGETSPELPVGEDRAGYYFAFDAEGDPVMASGTGSDAALRTDLASGIAGALLVAWKTAGAGAVVRTLWARLANLPVDAEDFGVVADGVTDDYAGLQAAITFAAGRAVKLPGRKMRCGSPLTDFRYASTNDLPGLTLEGEGAQNSVIEFDFDGDYAIYVRGTDATIGKYQKGGGLRGVGLRPADGRTITDGLRIVGWWLVKHDGCDFGGFDGSDRRGFVNGVRFPVVGPTAGGVYGNVDYYQSTHHIWQSCTFRANTVGVLADNGQGSAVQSFKDCVITHNLTHGASFFGSNWSFEATAIAYNGLGGVSGNGVNAVSTSNSITNVRVENCEIDGNLEAGIKLRLVRAALINQNRFISRRLADVNGVSRDFCTSHIYVDNTGGGTIYAIGNYHRIDCVGFADPVQGTVTLYNGGAGSVTTTGCIIDGAITDAIGPFISGTITNGSPTVTGVSSFNGLQVGQAVKDTQQRVPYGTTILSLNPGGGTLTMTANATATPGAPINLRVYAEHAIASAGILNPRYHNYVSSSTGVPLSSRRADFCLTGHSVQGFANVAAPWVFTIEETGFTEGGIVDPCYESATGGIRFPHMGKSSIMVRFVLAALLTGDTVTVRILKNGVAVTYETVTIAPTVDLGQFPFDLDFVIDHDIGDLGQIEIVDTNAIGTAGHALDGRARLEVRAL